MARLILDVGRSNRGLMNSFKTRLTDHVLGTIGGNDRVNIDFFKTMKGNLRIGDITQLSTSRGDGNDYAMCGFTVVGGSDVVQGTNDDTA